MTGRTIKALPITAERFAPFGDVIVAGQAPMTTMNEARFQQFANLANVDIDPAGAVSIGIVRSKSPTSFPYHFDMVERHPLGSQAFIPLTEFVFVVVVAVAVVLSLLTTTPNISSLPFQFTSIINMSVNIVMKSADIIMARKVMSGLPFVCHS